MRNLSKLIIILLLSVVSRGMTADFIQGRVIAIDRDKGVLQLQLSGKNQGRCCATKDTKASAAPFIIRIAPDRLPRYVREGGYVFVWGAYLQNRNVESCDFQAETIRSGCYQRYCDPTGVRSRIGKCYMGKGRHQGRRNRQRCHHAPPQDNTLEQNASQAYPPGK